MSLGICAFRAYLNGDKRRVLMPGLIHLSQGPRGVPGSREKRGGLSTLHRVFTLGERVLQIGAKNRRMGSVITQLIGK